jgi:hypothetical protein
VERCVSQVWKPFVYSMFTWRFWQLNRLMEQKKGGGLIFSCNFGWEGAVFLDRVSIVCYALAQPNYSWEVLSTLTLVFGWVSLLGGNVGRLQSGFISSPMAKTVGVFQMSGQDFALMPRSQRLFLWKCRKQNYRIICHTRLPHHTRPYPPIRSSPNVSIWVENLHFWAFIWYL